VHKPQADDRIALAPRLRYRAVGDEGVLVHLDSGRVIVVNEVGLYIIQQLKRPMTRQSLVDAIVNEFNVAAPEAEQDLERYLLELGSEQVLEPPTVGSEK
jgi:hypothetical protein